MADLDGLCFRKRRNSLVPADFRGDEWMASVKDGAEVIVRISKPRNPKFHRLAFGLLRLVIENTDHRWPDENHLLRDLKEATGLGEHVVNALTGQIRFLEGSISFASMDQDKFKAWMDQAVTILATQILRTEPQALLDEVFALYDPSETAWKIVARPGGLRDT